MIKHRGWAMTMGRVACGRRPKLAQLATNESTVTCRACLRTMISEERKDIHGLRYKLATAEKTLRQLERQLYWESNDATRRTAA